MPNTPATVFRLASVSKQFTAFAIYLLAQDGKLSLDDDVRKYVPKLHDFGKARASATMPTSTCAVAAISLGSMSMRINRRKSPAGEAGPSHGSDCASGGGTRE